VTKQTLLDRFLVLGDLHIGLVTKSRDTDGVPDRHIELMDSIKHAFKYAISKKVTYIVIVGDLFHINNPSQMYYADLFPMFRDLSKAGIAVYLLSGNHDAINTIPKANALRSLFKSDIEYISVINEISCVKKLRDKYNLLFIPHINRCEYSQYTPEAESKLIKKAISYQKLEGPTLVFGHAMVANSIQGAERLIMRGGEQCFDVAVPTAKAYFFGHMHTPQEMVYKGVPLYYTGSMQTVDMSERNDEKSFIDVKVDEDVGLTIKRVAVPTRKFYQIDIPNYEEYVKMYETSNVATDTSHPERDDSILKVVLNLNSDQKNLINESKINDYHNNVYWIDIEYNLTRRIASRNVNVTIEADPDVAFQEWYISKGYDESEMKDVMVAHTRIMEEATALKE